MFEKFTDRARRVMALANTEAQSLNHEYIATEHILLGLVKGGGVASHVLKDLNVDLDRLRNYVEKLATPGEPGTDLSGTLTPRAKNVIEYSLEAAQRLDHRYVGTEHLLLGLACEKEGFAAQVLLNFGVDSEMVRTKVLQVLGRCED